MFNSFFLYTKRTIILFATWIFIVELILAIFFNFIPFLDYKYYLSAFEGLKIPKSVLGWDLYNGKGRPNDNIDYIKCGEVYGDSFTHGDEISDSDTWVNKVGQLSKCQIVNYGVSGYGLDQTYLNLMQKIEIDDRGFIAIGIYSEMLRRNMAASWLFYSDNKQLPIKPYFNINSNQELVLHEPTLLGSTLDDIKLHHKHDKFYEEYQITWPYSVWSIREIYRKYTWSVDKNAYLDDVKINHPYANVGTTLLAEKILEKAVARARGRKLFIVFYPTPGEAFSGWYPYSDFLIRIREILPKVCIIDTGPALHAESLRLGRILRAPNGHFDADGHTAIANEFYKEMKYCRS